MTHLSTVENLFSLHLPFCYLFSDGLTNFMFIVVEVGPVKVPVPLINGHFHCLIGLPRDLKW